MITVKGRTLDIDGYLPSVNIVEVGTNNSKQSDLNGNFTINVNSIASKLRFSFVGYATTEMTASQVLGQKFITLAIDSELLDEVVITTPVKNKSDNNLWKWILGAAIVFGTYKLATKSTPQSSRKPRSKPALKSPKQIPFKVSI